jgi:transcriptional regulator with XRE-family HTH domain
MADAGPADEAAEGTAGDHSPFDTGGHVRRCRRIAGLSQRAIADRVGLSQSMLARVETGRQDLGVTQLVALARCAGLRLALLDGAGREVAPMRALAVRDRGWRRFPAHVDVRHGDEWWWRGDTGYHRSRPTFTFTRDVAPRDDDHKEPDPRDDLEWRRRDRVRAALQRQEEEYARRVASGEVVPEVYDLLAMCECPPGCEELLVGDDPAGQADPHVPDCPCRCDIH